MTDSVHSYVQMKGVFLVVGCLFLANHSRVRGGQQQQVCPRCRKLPTTTQLDEDRDFVCDPSPGVLLQNLRFCGRHSSCGLG